MTDTTIASNEELTYRRRLLREEWKAKRKIILRRDGHRCRHCGAEKDLQVHHRQYHVEKITGRWKKPWDYEDRYLITLCDGCHRRGHALYAVPEFTVDFLPIERECK